MRIGARAAKAAYFLGALVFEGLAADPASAGSLPAPGQGWSGCHAGLNAGWIGDATDVDLFPSGDFNTILSAADIAFFTQRHSFDNSGFSGGVMAGCDRQRGRRVLGFEADFNGTTLDSDINRSFGLQTAPSGQTRDPHTDILSNRLNWYSTLRARAGLATGRALFFATAGLAVGNIETDTLIVTADNDFGSRETTRAGWTAGGGAEVALRGNWTARVEYLYLDFDGFSFDIPSSQNPAFTFTSDVDPNFHVVRAALTYRFGPRSETTPYK